MECPQCGSIVNSNKLFCPECEAPLHLSDAILPIREDGPPPARVEEAKPDQEEIHRRTVRAWVIRIAITVLMIGILILALLLLASSRHCPAAAQESKNWGQVLSLDFSGVRGHDPIQGSNISSGASGRSSGETPVPVCATSHSPPVIFRR